MTSFAAHKKVGLTQAMFGFSFCEDSATSNIPACMYQMNFCARPSHICMNFLRNHTSLSMLLLLPADVVRVVVLWFLLLNYFIYKDMSVYTVRACLCLDEDPKHFFYIFSNQQHAFFFLFCKGGG